MAFAVGLAIFGSALSTGLRAYLTTAAAEQRDILDRIALESAMNATLGQMVSNRESPVALVSEQSINGRVVKVELASPVFKYDLNGDDEEELMEALDPIAKSGKGRDTTNGIRTLDQLVRTWRLSTKEEDCARRRVTAGRAPAPRLADDVSSAELIAVAGVGDQLDLRASITSDRGELVMWVRARLTGQPTRPWRYQDYRILSINRENSGCEGVVELSASR
jgi:hypothetical protein